MYVSWMRQIYLTISQIFRSSSPTSRRPAIPPGIIFLEGNGIQVTGLDIHHANTYGGAAAPLVSQDFCADDILGRLTQTSVNTPNNNQM